MNRLLLLLAAFLALSTPILPASAQNSAVPNSMNFQGRLAAPSGNPVPNGTYSIRFSLWNVASGGTAAANEKYNKTIAAVQVKNGTFAVTLDAFPATLFSGNLWLEIKVGSDAVLTPRTPLNTVPYAFKANSVKDGAIGTASLANGAITDAKVSSVAWSKITGVPSSLLTLPFAATQSLDSPGILFSIKNTGSGNVINAEATYGDAVHAKSSNIAVYAESTDAAAVYGYSRNVSGIFGISDNFYGVWGYAANNHGVYGITFEPSHGGVVGDNSANGNRGVLAGPGYGVGGGSVGGNGGEFNTTGPNGVYAYSTGENGNGIAAYCNNGSNAYGVWGTSSTGRGVVGNGVIYGVYSYGQAAGTTGWANVSDIRYKQNIASFENALDAILNLRGVTYEYRRDEFKNMNFPKGTHIGFIAQEIEKILPEVVTTDENGYKSVTYANVVPVLVEAVKTLNARTVLQQKQMSAKDAEIGEMRTAMKQLAKRLEALEAQQRKQK